MAKQVKVLGLLCAAMIISVMFCSQASAQTAVAVVDINKVVSECKAGKRAQTDIRQRFERENTEINKLAEELQAMQQDYQKQVSMMNESAKTKRQKEIEEKFQAFNQRRMKATQEITEAERQALAPIVENLKAILEDMGKRNKYAVILDLRNAPYYAPSIDITQDVIKAYDRAHP